MSWLQSLATEASEIFSYLAVYAPRLPREDRTSTTAELEKLGALLASLRDLLEPPEPRQALALAVAELGAAVRAFEAALEAEGRRLLRAAEEHFRAACEGRAARNVFVGDPEALAGR